MSIQRLCELRKVAEKIDMSRLDMRQWFMNDCGTVACLGGFACLHPPFQALGLGHLNHRWPTYRGEHGMRALRDFFDINRQDAFHLFDPDSYVYPLTRDKLLGQIDDVIKMARISGGVSWKG